MFHFLLLLLVLMPACFFVYRSCLCFFLWRSAGIVQWSAAVCFSQILSCYFWVCTYPSELCTFFRPLGRSILRYARRCTRAFGPLTMCLPVSLAVPLTCLSWFCHSQAWYAARDWPSVWTLCCGLRSRRRWWCSVGLLLHYTDRLSDVAPCCSKMSPC